MNWFTLQCLSYTKAPAKLRRFFILVICYGKAALGLERNFIIDGLICCFLGEKICVVLAINILKVLCMSVVILQVLFDMVDLCTLLVVRVYSLFKLVFGLLVGVKHYGQ